MRGGFVCLHCWFAFAVGFGDSRPPFVFGVGFGRVRWFHLFLVSARRVCRRSRYLAEKWGVFVVSMPRLNSTPRIPAAKSGRPADAL